MSSARERTSLVRRGWTQRDTLHGLHILTSLVAFILVQLEVPEPYLDEIFHIPQTQKYCAGDFDNWDPAITTPPGLYLLSSIPLSILHIPCSPLILRFTNLLFNLILLPSLISIIISTPSPTRTVGNNHRPYLSHLLTPSSSALTISSFPLIFFFSNLYYTDIASLAGVLACLALTGRRRYWLASIVGAWSVCVRQTNIVWVGFGLGVEVLRVIAEEVVRRHKDGDGEEKRGDLPIGEYKGLGQAISSGNTIARVILDRPGKIAKVVVPYLPTFAGFAVFLRWNRGIVLGHKENHQPVMHLPQSLYLLAFATIMLFPALMAEGLLGSVRGVWSLAFATQRRMIILAIMGCATLYSIHKYTIFHPFLLADNRHYVFYLLRWVLLPYSIARYALTPVYMGCIYLWIWRLRSSATIFWLTGFTACTAITLIPTPLIEPRYFLIPTILLRIQLANARRGSLWLEYGWYTLINVLTVGLFLGKKFRWEGWEGWMRFMW